MAFLELELNAVFENVLLLAARLFGTYVPGPGALSLGSKNLLVFDPKCCSSGTTMKFGYLM
jgi:hypothetical protein